MKEFEQWWNKWKERNEGYVSIEAVFAMSFFLIMFILVIGFFTYIYPYTSLQREVHVLASIAERQGGLTPQDISDFQDKISQQHDFIQNSPLGVEVTAVTQPSGTDVSNVIPLGEEPSPDTTDYIHRDSKEVINITVTVPANTAMLKPVADFFQVKSFTDTYVLTEPVMSERY